jgi:hypothetical protein
MRIALTDATAYCELKAHSALVELAVSALAEGASIHATTQMVQCDKHTICAWLNRAARQCRRVMLAHWQYLHVTVCPWDALWSVVQTQEPHLLTTKGLCDSYGDA